MELKNTLVLDCILWKFTWDFEKAVLFDRLECNFAQYKERKEMILSIEKSFHSQVKIEMKRTNFDPSAEQDKGYYLELIFSLLGHRELPDRRVMGFWTDKVAVDYNVSHMKKATENANYWVIKCVIKLHEDTLLQNDARKEQDELILNLERKYQKYPNKLKSMAYLMGRKSLTDIFSGRQTFIYAFEKAGVIERTLKFAHVIANKVRNKNRGIEHTTDISPEEYLQYIYDGKSMPIKKHDLLSLYALAQFFGLTYLTDECVDCMFNLLEGDKDKEYIVSILLSSITADDRQLMKKALDVFNENKDSIILTGTWKKLAEENIIFNQIIEDEAKRRLQSQSTPTSRS